MKTLASGTTSRGSRSASTPSGRGSRPATTAGGSAWTPSRSTQGPSTTPSPTSSKTVIQRVELITYKARGADTFRFRHSSYYKADALVFTNENEPRQGWGGSESHDLNSQQLLSNFGTGTELGSNFFKILLTGTEAEQSKTAEQQVLVRHGSEEL